jgi:nickel-dependent lactate racemase
MSFVRLMEYAWSDNPREVEYYLPDSWDVAVYHFAGYQKPVLTPDQTRQAVLSPLGTSSIRDLAGNKKKVCILFDDMSRGTPVRQIVPYIIEELKAGGIEDKQIELICAMGAHQLLDRISLVQKVGEEIMARYPVFNHNPFVNFSRLGATSFGSKVEINAEVMSCDLKISVSSVVPHPQYGFSGGPKIIIPGVASIDSIAEQHHVIHKEYKNRTKKTPDTKGLYDNNPMPVDALEFARMAGLDYSINCILNEKCEIVNVFAGDVEAAYKAAVIEAREHYRVQDTRDNDIVIANAFNKATEAYLAGNSAFISVKRSGGTAVVIANAPQGRLVNNLLGAWGISSSGKMPFTAPAFPSWIEHFVYHTEYPEARNWYHWNEKDWHKVIQPSSWTEVIAKLIEWHGFKAKVAVFPDAATQYTVQPEYQTNP